MKPIKTLALIFLAINGLLTANFVEAKSLKAKKNKKKNLKKQVHVVHDQNKFHSSINQVVRRNPTLHVETKLGAERLAAPEPMLHMSNSNTSNGYNLGTFGRKAEIVGKNFSFLFFIFLLFFCLEFLRKNNSVV